VALVAVRPDPDLAPYLATLPLLPEATAVRRARAFLRASLAPWDVPADLLPTAELLVGELVTNGIRHAHGDLELRLHRTERELYIEVVDGHGRIPHRRQFTLDREDRRGLNLVDALASRWGARILVDGRKVVWCALRLPARDTVGSSRRRDEPG